MRLRRADDEVPLVLGLRMSRVICPFPLYAFMACIRDNFTVCRVEKGSYNVIW